VRQHWKAFDLLVPGCFSWYNFLELSLPLRGPSVRREVESLRPYEILFVLKPDLEEEATTAAIDRFANLIQQNQGSVEQISRWGKRRLAYEIAGYREGYYTLILFQGEPATAKELDRVMLLTDEVLRHIIVRRDAA
jgi:small subunit ribosomal protein S6